MGMKFAVLAKTPEGGVLARGLTSSSAISSVSFFFELSVRLQESSTPQNHTAMIKNLARALYEYRAGDADELAVDEDGVVLVLDDSEPE